MLRRGFFSPYFDKIGRSLASPSPTKWKAEKNGFLVFSKLFLLLRASKTPQIGHFVRFCGIFAAPQNYDITGATKGAAKEKNLHKIDKKRCNLRHRKNAGESHEVTYLRHFCGAYTCSKPRFLKKSQNPFTMLLLTNLLMFSYKLGLELVFPQTVMQCDNTRSGIKGTCTYEEIVGLMVEKTQRWEKLLKSFYLCS